MSTLSQFFGGGGGGALSAGSEVKYFFESDTITIPSNVDYVAYAVMGGGGEGIGGGSGGGFSWRDGNITCDTDFTVCAVVGSGGSASCITGLCTGVISATGGGGENSPGVGSGGTINTCGGSGGGDGNTGAGGGAGGLTNNGGDGGRDQSGGGGMSSGPRNDDFAFLVGGTGGYAESDSFTQNGSNGFVGAGGIASDTTEPVNCSQSAPTSGFFPSFTTRGYSQSKTFLFAAGGGGATQCNPNKGQNGAPGGGGGWRASGGFGGGSGAGNCCAIGGRGGGTGANSGNCVGNASPGFAVIEYWISND